MTTASDDRDYVSALGQQRLMSLDPARERAGRFLSLIGTFLLALVVTIAPALGAYASAGHDHTLGGHSLQVERHGDDHDHNASFADDNVTHGAADTLCCEDIGLCSAGFVLPLSGSKTSSPHVASYGLPDNALPWYDHLGRPDGPPPRSHS